MSKGSGIRNAVFIADLHSGCQFALCPKRVRLNGGGVYRASNKQIYVLKCWEHFWREWVPTVTRGEKYVVVINGDAMDNRHHGTTTQISHNLSDQMNIAYELLEPIRASCEEMYLVGGTEAHSGPASELEEKLGERLKTKIDEVGNRCRPELQLEIGSCLIHATHHIGTTGSSHFETSALMGEYTNAMVNAAKWGHPRPDVVVRSHRHVHSEIRVPTQSKYGYCFVTAGWQLKTPFAFRTPGGRAMVPMIDGSLVRQGDEEFFTRHETWSLAGPRTEVPR